MTKFSTKGITLIEAMVAVFVLTLGIVGILHMFPIGIQTVFLAQTNSVAIKLAQEGKEEMISRPYVDIVSVPRQTLSPPFGAYSREIMVTCFDPNGTALMPNCPETGIRRIEVMVFWRSPVGAVEKSVNLVGLITNR